MSQKGVRFSVLIAANAVVWCVLSFYGTIGAAPKNSRQPFANPVEQRQQMIRELQDIKALLKEQNALLKAKAGQESRNDRRAQ